MFFIFDNKKLCSDMVLKAGGFHTRAQHHDGFAFAMSHDTEHGRLHGLARPIRCLTNTIFKHGQTKKLAHITPALRGFGFNGNAVKPHYPHCNQSSLNVFRWPLKRHRPPEGFICNPLDASTSRLDVDCGQPQKR